MIFFFDFLTYRTPGTPMMLGCVTFHSNFVQNYLLAATTYFFFSIQDHCVTEKKENETWRCQVNELKCIITQ